MFAGETPYTPWTEIEHDITKAAKSESELHFNLAVAESLYRFGHNQEAHSYKKLTPPWAVGFGQVVAYWWNFYTVLDSTPCFLFVDPRLTAPLTAVGRRFVFSLMHERIRVVDPDFASARLLIAQFGKPVGGVRPTQLFEAGDDLFSMDALNEMIDETYRMWIEVLGERDEAARASPASSTPMGF
jgi:hypothetical protein